MSRPDRENPEDRLEQTARELRKHRPRPSAALAARVERLAESQAERSRRAWPRLSRRRMVFALAAALVVAAASAVVAGELGQSSRNAASGTTAEKGMKQGLSNPTKHYFAAVPSPTSGNAAQSGTPPSSERELSAAGARTTGESTIPTSTSSGSYLAPPVRNLPLAHTTGTVTTTGTNLEQLDQALNGAASSAQDVTNPASTGARESARASIAPIVTGKRLAELTRRCCSRSQTETSSRSVPPRR